MVGYPFIHTRDRHENALIWATILDIDENPLLALVGVLHYPKKPFVSD